MPRVIETTVYKFEELNDKAKEKARDWWREHVFSDSSDWDHVYSDANEIAARLGIEIDTRTFKTVGGKGGTEPCIYFSGFSNQGDGACFEGRYSYCKGALKEVQSYAPQDTTLHGIATALQEVQARNFYKITAVTKHRGHYNHSGCMDVEVERSDGKPLKDGDEHEVRAILRGFADWIYRQLEHEYHYQLSEEAVDESITANDYEFNEDGSKA